MGDVEADGGGGVVGEGVGGELVVDEAVVPAELEGVDAAGPGEVVDEVMDGNGDERGASLGGERGDGAGVEV